MPETVPGTLFVVGLPIGNVRDITYRAVDVLSHVAIIAAEDTRTTGRLLGEHHISTPTVSYHDFNEQTRTRHLLDRLLSGQDVALVSEAGTPLVNDPGYRIVVAAIEAGIRVTSIPGACAAVTALVASGLPANRFLFVGFPPRTSARRIAWYATLRAESATLILYEAPHRLVASLKDMYGTLGDRRACVAASITKEWESYVRGSVTSILEQLEQREQIRGEHTIIVAGAAEQHRQDDEDGDAAYVEEMAEAGLDSRTMLDRLQSERGMRRRDAYALILRVTSELTLNT